MQKIEQETKKGNSKVIKFRAWLNMQEEMLYENIYGAEKFGGRDCEIMQYTGLKDINGIEIYEGDMVKFYISSTTVEDIEIVAVVSFFEGTYQVMNMNGDPISLRDAIKQTNKLNKSIEIIGNIYQNPELLK